MTLATRRLKKRPVRSRAQRRGAGRSDDVASATHIVETDTPVVVRCRSPEVDVEERRLLRLIRQPIEHVFSPSFAHPAAAEKILAPFTPCDIAETNADAHLANRAIKAPEGCPPYLAALYQFPLLTREEEFHLFRMMNYLKYRAERLRQTVDFDHPHVGRLDQMRQYLKDAKLVRDRIVQANLRLVVSIAKTLVDRDNSLDDLISDGNVPLLRAVEIFDFQRGTRFSTYATWAIRNALYRSSPRNRRRRCRFASNNEIALEGICDARATLSSTEARFRGVNDFVRRVLPQLDKRDRLIVMYRFGLGIAQRPHRFREIAARHSVSTERVRQLLRRALRRMRALAARQPATDGLGPLGDEVGVE